MNKLTQVGSFVKIKRGLWAWPNSDPLVLTPYLTNPFSCYISLQSALFYHEVIEQVPAYYYVISLGRKKIEHTPLGVFSIHHITNELFTDFETHYNPYYQIATAEKAFFDYLYMGRIEPSLFGKLPEIDKSKLNIHKIRKMINLVKHPGAKTYLLQKLSEW
jgi:predicted transcriptional regulator of viral defense system